MDIEDVSEEFRAALDTITDLRVPLWGVERISTPAAIVALPDRINFDETYGRGKDQYEDLAVVVLVASPESRVSRKTIAAYADGSGPKSVKATLEGYAWTSCESVHVQWCEFDASATYAGVAYLAAIFHVNIIGKGV